MRITFKRILSKHNREEDIIAWKGFLLGITISISLIGPITSLILVFLFNEHTDIDEEIVEHITSFVKVITSY